MADPRASGVRRKDASASTLAISLSLFVVLGAAAALFLWWGLNQILEGRNPPASVWAVSAGALVVLVLLAVGLARLLRRVEDTSD